MPKIGCLHTAAAIEAHLIGKEPLHGEAEDASVHAG